ncbi:MAG: hypothetical protein AVDCRST_MAG69-2144, partial [uncultured Solirubrobacteraceae bacterium]
VLLLLKPARLPRLDRRLDHDHRRRAPSARHSV